MVCIIHLIGVKEVHGDGKQAAQMEESILYLPVYVIPAG